MIYCLVMLAVSFGFKQSATTALEPYLPFYNYNFNQARPTSLEDGLPSKSQLLTVIQNLLNTVHRLQDTREHRGHGGAFSHSNPLDSVLKRLKIPLPDLSIESPSPILPFRTERARMSICDFYGCKESNGFNTKFRTERTRMPICDFYGCREGNGFDTKFNAGRFGLERFLCKKLNQRLDNQHLEAILEDLIKPMYSMKQFEGIPEGVNADSAPIKFNFPNQIPHVKPRPVLQHNPFMPIPFAFGSFSGPLLEQRKPHTTKSPPKVSTLKIRGSSPQVKAKADPFKEVAQIYDVIDLSTQASSSTSDTYSSSTVRPDTYSFSNVVPDIYSSSTVLLETTTAKAKIDDSVTIPVNSLNDSLSIEQRVLSSELLHNNRNGNSNSINEVTAPHIGKAGASHLSTEKIVTTNTSSSEPDVTIAALEVPLPPEKSNYTPSRSNSEPTGFSDKFVVTSTQAAPVQTLNLAPPAQSAAAHEVVDEIEEEDIVEETEQKEVVEETVDKNESFNEPLDAAKMLSGDVSENGTSSNAAPVQTLNLALPAQSAAAHEVIDEIEEGDIVKETEQKEVVEKTVDKNEWFNKPLDAAKMLSGDVSENGTSSNALKENEQVLPLNASSEATNAIDKRKAEEEALQDLHVRRKRETVTEVGRRNRFLLKPIEEFLAEYHAKLKLLEGDIKTKIEKFFSRRSMPDNI